MSAKEIKLNPEVTKLLDELNHPLREEIEQLRIQILTAHGELSETIKWNGPNYSINTADRITMRVQPPKQIQIILHRGVKKQPQPKEKLIENTPGWLDWKENDRAVVTIKNGAEIENRQLALSVLIKDWITATT